MKPFNKTLRLLCILHFLFGGTMVQAQEIKERKLRTLYGLGLPYQDFDLANAKINADFRKILKLEKRRKSQKIAGYILLPLGAAATGLGVSMISNSNSYRKGEGDPEAMEYEENPSLSLNRAVGSVLVAVGTVHIAVSIPMFVGSVSKKRKRNRLLFEYKYMISSERDHVGEPIDRMNRELDNPKSRLYE